MRNSYICNCCNEIVEYEEIEFEREVEDGFTNYYTSQWKCPHCGSVDELEVLHDLNALAKAISILENTIKAKMSKEDISKSLKLIEWVADNL